MNLRVVAGLFVCAGCATFVVLNINNLTLEPFDDLYPLGSNRNRGNRQAITVLTRVFENYTSYNRLIKRTNRLLERKWARDNFDFIIFHEPALPSEHKEYILSNLKPNRPFDRKSVLFEDVSHVIKSGLQKMNPEGQSFCPSSSKIKKFTIGYKGMCYFWYGGFVHTEAAKIYKSFLRVDDDCFIERELEGFSPVLRSHLSTVTFVDKEHPSVMVGMDSFFGQLALDRQLGKFPPNWKLPYTNFMWFDLDWVRSSQIQMTLNAVHSSGCMISNRWGDLPLWGATAALHHVNIETIKLEYLHGSHKKMNVSSDRIASP